MALELGPEPEFERAIKLANEMKAERMTSLDWGSVKDAKENVLFVSAASDNDRGRQALRVGRLRHLERMGLAEEKKTGVWSIDPQIQTKLQSMSQRSDIMVTMNKVLHDHGLDRPAGDFAIFSGAPKAAPVIGRVLEVGIADEMTDRKYLVVDGIDGRIKYAETSKLDTDNIPTPGMIVAMSGGSGKGKMRNTQVEIVSYVPVEQLPSVEAANWLDQTIVAEKKPMIHNKGFGAEVSKALVAREDWLIAKGYEIAEQPGMITLKPNMIRDLNQRGLIRTVDKLSTELRMGHISMVEGQRFDGYHARSINLPTQRLAVIKGREDYTLIPWRKDLAKMQGQDLVVRVDNRAVTLTIATGRDRGLSR